MSDNITIDDLHTIALVTWLVLIILCFRLKDIENDIKDILDILNKKDDRK